MKQKLALMVIAVLMLVCPGGCGKQDVQRQSNTISPYAAADQASEQPEQHDSENNSQIDEQPDSSENQDSSPADGNQLFAGCTLTGTVTEFSDDGCKITPTIQEGDLAYEAAPGYEDEAELINIIYDEKCSFRMAYVNRLNGAVTYDTASPEDVKKQTSLIIYGTYDSNNILVADHLYIYRSTEG